MTGVLCHALSFSNSQECFDNLLQMLQPITDGNDEKTIMFRFNVCLALQNKFIAHSTLKFMIVLSYTKTLC